MVETPTISVLAIVAAVVLGWIMSGRVRTTDADRLWAEAADLREEYKDRVEALEAKVIGLEQNLREERRARRDVEAELREHRQWRSLATPILEQVANGDPAMRAQITRMKLIEEKR